MNTAESPLLPVSSLDTQLGAHDLRIIDCRFDLADKGWGRRVYDEAHIPGAHYAHLDDDLSSPRTPQSGRHPLPTPETFTALLKRAGVTRSSRVVAYDQGNGAMASRLWWMLRAAGHRTVQVLDGGFAAWRAWGGPVTNERTPDRSDAPIAVNSFEGWVTTDELQQALSGERVRLVDARPADRFGGRNETIDPVAGHVPGAINHPFATNLGSDGKFLPREELAARWRETLGGTDGRDVVLMCGSGVTACHDLLAMEIAGLPGAKLYPGSWSEWIRDPSRAVAN
ncbi:MAG: sulfurtransferase [Steroidobacteraceae bacterium]